MCSSSYHLAPLSFYRECVAKDLGERVSGSLEPLALPLFPDVHVISSCLQKALRRGDVDVGGPGPLAGQDEADEAEELAPRGAEGAAGGGDRDEDGALAARHDRHGSGGKGAWQ